MTAKLTPAARKARNARRTAQGAFASGLVISVAANIAVSPLTPVGIITAVWAPVALLLSLALLENGSISGRWAKVAVGFLALIAGVASYFHLVEFFQMGGADVLVSYALPLTVDVMMGMASAGMRAKAPARTTRKAPAKRTATAPARRLKVAN